MRKTILTKIAAGCGALMLGISGLPAYAQTDKRPEDRDDLVEGKPNIVAGIVKAEAGETVKFPVYLINNREQGFTNAEIRLIYDERLVPVLKENGALRTKRGEVADDVNCSFSLDAENHTITLITSGEKAECDSGLIYTVEMIVPMDARNDTYEIKTEVRKFADAEQTAIPYAAADGYIYEETFYHDCGPSCRGNVNGFSGVDAGDAQLVLEHYTETLAGNAPELTEGSRAWDVADVDGNHTVDIMDAQYILMYYVLNTVTEIPTDWDTIISGNI